MNSSCTYNIFLRGQKWISQIWNTRFPLHQATATHHTLFLLNPIPFIISTLSVPSTHCLHTVQTFPWKPQESWPPWPRRTHSLFIADAQITQRSLHAKKVSTPPENLYILPWKLRSTFFFFSFTSSSWEQYNSQTDGELRQAWVTLAFKAKQAVKCEGPSVSHWHLHPPTLSLAQEHQRLRSKKKKWGKSGCHNRITPGRCGCSQSHTAVQVGVPKPPYGSSSLKGWQAC